MNIYSEKIRVRTQSPMIRLLLNITPSYKQDMVRNILNKKSRK